MHKATGRDDNADDTAGGYQSLGRRYLGNERLRLGILLVVGLFLLVGFVGAPATADDGGNTTDDGQNVTVGDQNTTDGSQNGTDDTANATRPVLHGGERVDTTTMTVLLTSAVGIDTDSVTQSEFFLSDGTLDTLDVVEEGTNVTVEFHLTEPVDVNEIVVAVSNATGIQDIEGNRLDTDVRKAVTIRGMDGVPPAVRVVDIPSQSGNETTITYWFDEQVSDLHVLVSGPEERRLDRDDFVRTAGYRYATTLELAEGEYTVELVNATDTAGNHAAFDIESPLEVITSPPEAVAEIAQNASYGQTVTFDAGDSGSTADSFVWEFGDGHTATGERVTHEFHPGVYLVALDVADEVGNVARDELVINVTAGADAIKTGSAEWPDGPQFDVQFPGPGIPFDVVTTVRGAGAGERVTLEVPGEGRPLLTHAAGTLETVNVTVTQNTTLGLALGSREADPSAFDDVENQTGNAFVGGLVARPTVTGDLVSDVTFEFTVTDEGLAAHDAGPGDVTLYRSVDGSWNELPTEPTGESDDSFRFSADSSGFSAFAITVETDLSKESDEDDDRGEESDGDRDDESTGDDESDEADDGHGETAQTDSEADDGTEGDEQDSDTDEDETSADSEETGDESDEADEQDESREEDETGTEGNEPDESDGTDEDTGTDDLNETADELPPEQSDETEEPDESDGRLFGVIPLGLVTTLFLYVGVPLLVVYSGLKSAAFYLGY